MVLGPEKCRQKANACTSDVCTYPSCLRPILPVFASPCVAGGWLAISHKYNCKFKYGKRSTVKKKRPAQDNIPDNDAMEVDRLHVNQKCVTGLAAGACEGLRIIFLYLQNRKTSAPFCAEVKKEREETNTTSEEKRTPGHHSTAPQNTAHGGTVPRRTMAHSRAAGDAARPANEQKPQTAPQDTPDHRRGHRAQEGGTAQAHQHSTTQQRTRGATAHHNRTQEDEAQSTATQHTKHPAAQRSITPQNTEGHSTHQGPQTAQTKRTARHKRTRPAQRTALHPRTNTAQGTAANNSKHQHTAHMYLTPYIKFNGSLTAGGSIICA